MNILILSVTAGQGHHQTGLAISSYFDAQGCGTLQLDCYEYLSPPIKELISNGYLMSTKFSPALYGRIYRLAEKTEDKEGSNLISKITNTIFYKKMTRFINGYKPEVIICTHVFAAVLLSYLKEKGLTVPTIGIVTDFTIHPFWESTNLDYYVIANEYLTPALMGKEIEKDKILPIGIPIFEKFGEKTEKAEARRLLGIDNRDTLLIMGGSMGFGSIVKSIGQLDELERDFQILTVCGNNSRLKARIDKLETKHKIYNYSYVENVDLMMDAADCVITKPGGLTVSEAMAKSLPLLITKPIPGQEERNSDFLLNFGCAMRISKTLPIKEVVSQFFWDGKKAENLRKNMDLIRKPNAVSDLYKFIMRITS